MCVFFLEKKSLSHLNQITSKKAAFFPRMTRAHAYISPFYSIIQTTLYLKKNADDEKNRTLIKLNQLQLNDGIQIKCLTDPCQLIENVFASHLDVFF